MLHWFHDIFWCLICLLLIPQCLQWGLQSSSLGPVERCLHVSHVSPPRRHKHTDGWKIQTRQLLCCLNILHGSHCLQDMVSVKQSSAPLSTSCQPHHAMPSFPLRVLCKHHHAVFWLPTSCWSFRAQFKHCVHQKDFLNISLSSPPPRKASLSSVLPEGLCLLTPYFFIFHLH